MKIKCHAKTSLMVNNVVLQKSQKLSELKGLNFQKRRKQELKMTNRL